MSNSQIITINTITFRIKSIVARFLALVMVTKVDHGNYG